MEGLVTLQYGSFTILGEQVKEYGQRTRCSKWVAEWTLQDHLYLSKLRREHPGWNATQHQEWSLFLPEHLLHNAAFMRRKECQRCSQAPQVEMAEVMAPEYPSIRTLLGSTDTDILKVAKVYWGSM